jgi:hypothetical protein
VLEEVMHDFKLGFKLLTRVLWLLCTEFSFMMMDMLLVANNLKNSQIALPVGLLRVF